MPPTNFNLEKFINNRYLGTDDIKIGLYTVVISYIKSDESLSKMIKDSYKLMVGRVATIEEVYLILGNTICDYIALILNHKVQSSVESQFMILSINIVNWVKVVVDLETGGFFDV